RHATRTAEQSARRHRAWRIITLLKAAADHRHDARLLVGEIDLIVRPRTFGPRRRWLRARLFCGGRNLGLAGREFGFMRRQFALVTPPGPRFDFGPRLGKL